MSKFVKQNLILPMTYTKLDTSFYTFDINIDINIRYSKKAKNILLKIYNSKIEVVIPFFTKNFNVKDFLNQKKTWINKHLKKQKPIQQIPNKIFIPYLNTEINIHNLNILKSNLRILAKKHFTFKLIELSKKTQLTFNKISIRNQKTLWGSCSKEKNISLNMKLLFFPPEIAEYVLLHEICHTKYFSHGVRFWQLVEKYCPNYKSYEIELKNYNKYIPSWFI